DIESGEFQRGDLTAGTHREAERLLLAVGSRTALRAADALHLALAGLLGARVFLTFDKRMSAAAEALGTLELPAKNLASRVSHRSRDLQRRRHGARALDPGCGWRGVRAAQRTRAARAAGARRRAAGRPRRPGRGDRAPAPCGPARLIPETS